MEERDKLYREALALIKGLKLHKQSILYHNIYTSKMSRNYVFLSRGDIIEMVKFPILMNK